MPGSSPSSKTLSKSPNMLHPHTAALLLACLCAAGCAGDGGGESEAEDSLETYACLHVAEGSILDVGQTREDAPTITIGRDPYRVNLYSGEAGYLRFETQGPEELVLQTDFAGTGSAVWNGEERVEIAAWGPNPTCEEDLPETFSLSVPGGEHWLEIGPVFQGNVWLMLSYK